MDDTTEQNESFDINNAIEDEKSYSYSVVSHLRKKSYSKGYKKGYNRGYVTALTDIVKKCVPEAKVFHNENGTYSISLGGQLVVMDHKD